MPPNERRDDSKIAGGVDPEWRRNSNLGNHHASQCRTDGPADAIAHGELTGGLVALFGADAAGGEASFRSEGLMLALLGTADPATLRTWFARLSEGGRVLDDLQQRPWGGYDGQVIDQYGLHWLIGFELAE